MDFGNGPVVMKVNCAPGLSECAKKVSTRKCPGGTICISLVKVPGSSTETANQFHKSQARALAYLEESKKRKAAARREKEPNKS